MEVNFDSVIVSYIVGVPKMLYFTEENEISLLVMELLGPNLDELFHFNKE